MLKKTHDTRGLIIAFVGVDGSGKSTTTGQITKWLNKKLECSRFYMGSGDGKTSLLMRILHRRKKSRHASGGDSDAKPKAALQPVSMFKNPIRYLRRCTKVRAIYSVERNNRKRLRIMQRYRLNGGISVLDRYPQTEFPGMNDGPKLVRFQDAFSQKGLITRLIRKEEKCLSIVQTVKPDVVFRLNISAETSMARKPEQRDIETYRKKIEDLRKITFQHARIIDIDAEQPYEQELLEIKKAIWELL